jgi:tetratricopeptide (TPR) repeat protein
MLNAEELLHLAIHASSVGEHHACMTYLKTVLQEQPRNGKAVYLLAVQHAELGLLERAISGLKTAVALEPQLEAARLQLGVLLLDMRRSVEAKEHFAVLRDSSDSALGLCSEAMIAVADNNLSLAKEMLARGVSEQTGNRALTKLMERLLDNLSEAAAASDAQANDLLLGAYRGAPR